MTVTMRVICVMTMMIMTASRYKTVTNQHLCYSMFEAILSTCANYVTIAYDTILSLKRSKFLLFVGKRYLPHLSYTSVTSSKGSNDYLKITSHIEIHILITHIKAIWKFIFKTILKLSFNLGLADGSDNCPLNANIGQEDNDSDGEGDACDLNDDTDSKSELLIFFVIFTLWIFENHLSKVFQ